jgi:hypothetical protein
MSITSPRTLVDLDPVVDPEGTADEDVEPARDVLEQVGERDGDAGRQQAEEGPELLQRPDPDPDEPEDGEDGAGVARRLARLVPDGRVVDPTGDAVDDEHSHSATRTAR